MGKEDQRLGSDDKGKEAQLALTPNTAFSQRINKENAKVYRIATGEYLRRLIVQKWGGATELSLSYQAVYPDLTKERIENVTRGRQRVFSELAEILSEEVGHSSDYWRNIEEKAVEVCPELLAYWSGFEKPKRIEGEVQSENKNRNNHTDAQPAGLVSAANRVFRAYLPSGSEIDFLAQGDDIGALEIVAKKTKGLEAVYGKLKVVEIHDRIPSKFDLD